MSASTVTSDFVVKDLKLSECAPKDPSERRKMAEGLEGFIYVVNRKPPDPCCFGSKIPRNTGLIGKGLSPFQKRKAPETFPNLGPGYYPWEENKGAMADLLKKKRSVKGVGPLASEDPRFKDKVMLVTPAPNKYSGQRNYGERTQHRAPFGTTVRRMVLGDNKLPGPGTYPVPRKKCRRTRFSHNLGHPKMIATVELNCVPKPKDSCLKCEEVCVGDYWHVDHTTFLCHACWEEEKYYRELYSEKELKAFSKIRNCSFVHRHEGTTAAIRLMPGKKVHKKIFLENYLDLYIKC